MCLRFRESRYKKTRSLEHGKQIRYRTYHQYLKLRKDAFKPTRPSPYSYLSYSTPQSQCQISPCEGWWEVITYSQSAWAGGQHHLKISFPHGKLAWEPWKTGSDKPNTVIHFQWDKGTQSGIRVTTGKLSLLTSFILGQPRGILRINGITILTGFHTVQGCISLINLLIPISPLLFPSPFPIKNQQRKVRKEGIKLERLNALGSLEQLQPNGTMEEEEGMEIRHVH